MRKHLGLLILAATFITTMAADDKGKPLGRDRTATTDQVERHGDVTYGRVKEFKARQKLVIDVDNAIDKSFDLTDEDVRVNLAGQLKVGDPVKVTEREVDGKKTVQVTKHTGGNVQHGDPGTAAGADRVERDGDVTYGRIKEFTVGQKVVIDVDNAIDKSFDLTDDDARVNLAAGLKAGDPVKVTEREVNGKKTVQIVKHTGGNVTHGDADRKHDRQK
jgi:ribosomal protein L21E